jgi:hypothetical protein
MMLPKNYKSQYPAFQHNFDVSVILPFFKKMSVFQRTLAVNCRFLQRNGIEVIIVMDEPTEKEAVIATVKKFPLINWRVIVNEADHEWRNPAKVINVGIRHASKTHIMVMGPDSEMATDIIYQLRMMADLHPQSFFTGSVAFVDYSYDHGNAIADNDKPECLYYGSIFTRREYLIAVGGYDEEYDNWGGEDDNVRARLQLYGLKKIKAPNCLLLHRELRGELETTRKTKHTRRYGLQQLERSFYPNSAVANVGRNWGTDFNKIIYDWRNNIYAHELCTSYLKNIGIQEFDLEPAAFKKRYSAIALVAVHNEENHIPDLFKNLEANCDGIIMLDDNSSDNSYRSANSRNLILKVTKRTRNGFDDLGNRNLLLDLASFFNSDYFFFIDADERIDERFDTPLVLAKQNTWDIILFRLVHLWGSDRQYRTDIPEKGEFETPGLIKRYRMFKNIGRMNIQGDKLHFEAVPYKTGGQFVASILINHYGMISDTIRRMKYERYSREDENLPMNPGKYDYFLDENAAVSELSKLSVYGKEIVQPQWQDYLFRFSNLKNRIVSN